MTQQRIYNFGDTLTQSKTKTQASKLLSSGVYEGMNPVITGPATFNLTPGAYLLGNGVLVSETTPVTNINYPSSWPPGLPVPPALTTDFTLTADHQDIQAIGGSPVSYNLRPGILPKVGSPLPSSVALLWIRHPGSASLNPGMFSLPVKVKNGDVLEDVTRLTGWVQAPFEQACDIVAGPNIQQQRVSFATGPQNTGLLVVNTGFGVQTLSFTLPIPRLPWARRVAIYGDFPASSSIGLNQTLSVATAGAAAGPSVTVNLDTTAGFSTGERVLFADPVSGVRQVTVIQNVVSGTQVVVRLGTAINVGTAMTSLYVVTAETGDILPCTPATFAGPLTGLGPTPAGVLQIASGPKPATIGVRIVVPSGATNAVFIKGFQFLGD